MNFNLVKPLKPLAKIAVLAVALQTLTACETLLQQQNPPAPATAPTQSAAQIYARPAERALINGLRFYEDGVFERAESSLKSALGQGLQDRRDASTAYKYLAFIACAFNRPTECEQNFQSALRVDPSFQLTNAEVGHPIWGPVYRRVTQMTPAPQSPQK